MNDRLERLLAAAPPYPRRIVCLTEETTETLYRLRGLRPRRGGVGLHGPPARGTSQAAHQRRSSTPTSIESSHCGHDLVLGFSDLQADLGRELSKRGVPVLIFNQRSVAEILQTVRVVSGARGTRGRGGGTRGGAHRRPRARGRSFRRSSPPPGASSSRSGTSRSSPGSAAAPSSRRSRAPTTSARRRG